MNARPEWRPAQLLLPVKTALAIALVVAVPASAVDECCTIVSVDPAAHQIVVRETASGLTKTLTIANSELLQQLQPGAAYGPGTIDGIERPPGDFEPDWIEECCNFRALPQGQTSTGMLTKPVLPAGTIQKVEECCNIVSVDQSTNRIVVRENTTGSTKTLSIANNELLRQLQPGVMYGPGAIDGIEKPPGDFEPNWMEDCCNFRALPQDLRNVSTSTQGMMVDLGPGVTITLQSLKRLGSRVVRLDFSVRNDSGDRVHLNNIGLLDDVHYSLRNVSVIDYDAGLRYGALIDSEGTCACSRGSNIGNLDNGQEARYWVQIKAPPGDVNIVSIDFAGRASLDNVPISP